MAGVPILSLMLLVPLLAGLACFALDARAARMVALVATLIDLALGVVLWLNYDIGGAQWQFTERLPLFAGFSYALGIDGIALMLIMCSSLLYEWMEWGIALALSSEAAESYNGQQGDVWDAHADMLLATVGAALVWPLSPGERRWKP